MWVMVGAIATVVTVFLGFGIFAYQQWFNVPQIAYEVLPPYRLPSPLSDRQVAIVVVSNIGAARATGLRITIRTSGPVQGLEINSTEEVVANEWQNQTSLTITMPRLVQDNQASFTLLVSSQLLPIERVDVVFDQGIGTERKVQVVYPSSFALPGFLLLLAAGFVLVGVEETLSARRRARRTEREP